jgi:hypothetical protein
VNPTRPRICPVCGTRLDTKGAHWDVGRALGVRAARTIAHYRTGDTQTNLVDGRVPVTKTMVTAWLNDRAVLRQTVGR